MQLFPELLGGVPKRQIYDNEIELPLQFHQSDEDDPTSKSFAVFIDKAKCFDLILPEVALPILETLGVPAIVVNACLGFYSSQKKIKLGSAYGKVVMGTNAAIQGCSLSILMVNGLAAVLTKRLRTVAPNVSSAVFVDDLKIWTKCTFSHDLQRAFDAISTFDTAVGQSINFHKTALLAKKSKEADRFLRTVTHRISRKTTIKSLGFLQSVGKKVCCKTQTERLDKAISTAKKIRSIPVERSKTLYVQSCVHFVWTSGIEAQLSPEKKINTLRSVIASVFSFKMNSIRSPFLLFATKENIF